MSLLIPTGEILMKWRESNASVRKNFSIGRIIFPLILVTVILGGLISLKMWAGTLLHFPFKVLLISPVIIFVMILSWFSAGAEVCLTESCIIRAAGRYGSRTNYEEIEHCEIQSDDFDGKKLSIVKINLKDKSKFRVNVPVERFIVPEDVNLDQVLRILQDKGITII